MKSIHRLFLALVLIGLFTLGGSESLWAQCSMCRTALTESSEGQQMARGFNTAILFLLGAPYLVFGTLAVTLWRRRFRTVGANPPAPAGGLVARDMRVNRILLQ